MSKLTLSKRTDSRRRARVARTLLFLVAVSAVWLQSAAAQDQKQREQNLVSNGGFEAGEVGWMWEQWKGKPLPGYIDKEDMYEGLASFKLHQDGAANGLHLAKAINFERGHDYALSFALKTQDVPGGAVRVRVLVDERGWLGTETGRVERVKTGETHDWKTYIINLPASALGEAEKLTVFFYHDQPGRGELGVDALSLSRLAEGSERQADTVAPQLPSKAEPTTEQRATAQRVTVRQAEARPRASQPPGTLDALNYTTGNPVVLFAQDDARVTIRVTPERALYRAGELPHVSIQHVTAPGAALAYRVVDGFGQVLLEKTTSADKAATADVPLPPGHGYYEVIATLTDSGQALAEARRSIGALPPPANPLGDEPFGLWIQGDEHYPELGARWTRVGIYWSVYDQQGDAYLERCREQLEQYHDQKIKVIAWPKHPHPHSVSREVIQDTPEAWAALEEFWTKMVQSLAGQVDAWGVVNEPIAGHWEGSDELIIRYWALMRKIIDRYDPGTPLIGPCLGLAPSNVSQYENLLKLGFGKYIDAVEIHTYITSPEDMDWAGKTRRILDMTKDATGKDLPIWSTEHGSSATYSSELLQAQHLMRSWLLCKKIGYPVMVWHMFSHPQGSDQREINFGIFRNVSKSSEGLPQPRPAGLAFGVMTRQLAGAEYKTELSHLGPAVNAYVLERDGNAVVALWTTSQKTYDVTLSAGDETEVTETGLFGRATRLEVRDGLVRVRVDRSPRFIAPLPAFYLQSQPVARLDKPIEVLPGESGQATVTLVNPTPEQARLRIEWLPSDGWQFALPQDEWSLGPRQAATVPLTATAPLGVAIGRYQGYGKVLLNDKYVTALAVEASVLPQVTVVNVGPAFDAGRPVLAATLRRLDPALAEAAVQLAGNRSAKVPVGFDGRDESTVNIPVDDAASDRLEDLTLNVYGSQGNLQVQESLRTSFVHANHVGQKPIIDGDLSDWPGTEIRDAFQVRWGWDEQHLYLAVRAADPTHLQNQQRVTEMWKDDSLQISVTADRVEQLVRESLPGLQETQEVSLDLALRQDGAAMYRHRTNNKHLAPVGEVGRDLIRYAVGHVDGVTCYEVQIPVEQVGLKPLRGGQVLRSSLLLNANEGHGRQTTEWFGGIKEAKDPNLFGHLILVDRAR